MKKCHGIYIFKEYLQSFLLYVIVIQVNHFVMKKNKY